MNTCYQGQPFSANYNPSYKGGGLLGHPGIDMSCGFCSPIHSPYDGFVYKVLSKERPSNDGSGFTGVFLIVDDGKELFEWLVGHCDPSVSVGTFVKKGDVIGTEANHGLVYSGNVQITLAMQVAGDQRGAHRHIQKRPIFKTKTLSSAALSSYNDLGGNYRDIQGFYYQIWNYNNGFNGCVDPYKPIFDRDLYIGSEGYDVFVLQRILGLLRHFKAEPTGFYGPFTAAAVSSYQKINGISPILGYFGSKTRASISEYLSPPPNLWVE